MPQGANGREIVEVAGRAPESDYEGAEANRRRTLVSRKAALVRTIQLTPYPTVRAGYSRNLTPACRAGTRAKRCCGDVGAAPGSRRGFPDAPTRFRVDPQLPDFA